MNAPRRNEVATIAGQFRRPVEILAIPLTAAESCRVANFELRTGMKIEQAILAFLDDELFALPVPSREQSTSPSAE